MQENKTSVYAKILASIVLAAGVLSGVIILIYAGEISSWSFAIVGIGVILSSAVYYVLLKGFGELLEQINIIAKSTSGFQEQEQESESPVNEKSEEDIMREKEEALIYEKKNKLTNIIVTIALVVLLIVFVAIYAITH